jgi:glycosyltransferase involved in cell wall biosynthesis
VLPKKGLLQEKLKKSGIPVIILKLGLIRRASGLGNIFKYFINTIISTIQIITIIHKYNIDLVHTNTILVHAGALAARLTGKKVVWHIRETITDPPLAVFCIYNLIRLLSHKIICISKNVNDNMVMIAGESEKISIVYNGVNLSKFTSEYATPEKTISLKEEFGIPKDHFVVGIVGRMAFWKGHDTFVKAAKIVLKHCHRISFLVAGDLDREINRNYYNDLICFIHDNHIRQNIIFTGFRSDAQNLYAIMDIAVVPSKRPEPFGLVAIEALAMGKPVIATNNGGTAEIISNTGLGKLILPDDHYALAREILSYLKCEADRNAIKKRAPVYIKNNFSIESYVGEVEKVYHEIL